MLAVSRAWVYEAARTRRIPSVRIGGEDGPLRFIAQDIEEWLAEARAGWTPGSRRAGAAGEAGRREPVGSAAAKSRKRGRPTTPPGQGALL
jgi:hypothetical protein